MPRKGVPLHQTWDTFTRLASRPEGVTQEELKKVSGIVSIAQSLRKRMDRESTVTSELRVTKDGSGRVFPTKVFRYSGEVVEPDPELEAERERKRGYNRTYYARKKARENGNGISKREINRTFDNHLSAIDKLAQLVKLIPPTEENYHVWVVMYEAAREVVNG